MLFSSFLFFGFSIYLTSAIDVNSTVLKGEVSMKLIGLKPGRDYMESVKVGFPTIAVLQDRDTLIEYEKNVNFRRVKVLIEGFDIEKIKNNIFDNLKDFMSISLKNNKLKVIEKDIFNGNTHIVGLDFTNNQIEEIEENAFDNMPHLVNVMLGDNKLRTLNSNWFLNSPKMVFFLAPNNLIEEIPENAFKNLGGVRVAGGKVRGLTLDFNNNKIKNIHPTAFRGIVTMTSLKLKNNSLVYEKFPKNLLSGIDVKMIDLRLNNIECIPKELYGINTEYFDCTY